MQQAVDFRPEFGTRFSVTVDTEEEFDWSGDFGRERHSLKAVPAIAEGQRYFQQAGVVPLYYVDAPVAESAVTAEILGGAHAAGRCDIGAHLHPWVNPPFVEQVSCRNSFAGNLDPATEFAKLQHLRDLLRNALGVLPVAYRAGRYGIGPRSMEIIARAGFRFDSSVRPMFDYRAEGGPDFRSAGNQPYWADAQHRLIELPLTTIMIGWASKLGGKLQSSLPKRAQWAVARSRMARRVPLTPEGIPAKLAIEAIDRALEQGLRLLNISFHSPSLAPGHTPYVRNARDLAEFYRWFDQVLDHFARRGVANASLDDIDRGIVRPKHGVVASPLGAARTSRYRPPGGDGPVAQWSELAAHNG